MPVDEWEAALDARASRATGGGTATASDPWEDALDARAENQRPRRLYDVGLEEPNQTPQFVPSSKMMTEEAAPGAKPYTVSPYTPREQQIRRMVRSTPRNRAEEVARIQRESDELPLDEAVLSVLNSPKVFGDMAESGLKQVDVALSDIMRATGAGSPNPEQGPSWGLGQAVGDINRAIFTDIPRAQGSFVFETLPRGALQMGSFVGFGALGRLILGKYGPAIAISMLGSGLEAAEIYERARRGGLSEAESAKLSRWGIPIGLLENLGITRILKAFGGTKTLKQVAIESLKGGAENFFQGAAQRFGQNAVARAHTKNQELFEGVGTDGSAEGILGAIFTLAAGYFGFKARTAYRKARTDAYTQQRTQKRIKTALETPFQPPTIQTTPETIQTDAPPTPIRAFTKAEILTPEGAAAFAEAYPDQASALMDKPTRKNMTGVMVPGENLVESERRELVRLLRETPNVPKTDGLVESPPPPGQRPPAASETVPPKEPVDENQAETEEKAKVEETTEAVLTSPPGAQGGAVDLARPAVPPVVKQPWEMTREEIENVLRNDDMAARKPVLQFLFPEIVNRKSPDPEGGDFSKSLWGEVNEPKRWGTGRVPFPWVARARKNAIELSVNEGKPVPAEVLADYPDLKAAAPGPPPRTADAPAQVDRIAEIRKKREAAKARVKARPLGELFTEETGGQQLDKQTLKDLIEIGVSYLEEGIVRIEDFTKALIADVGEWVRPYVPQILEASHKELGTAPTETTEAPIPQVVGVSKAEQDRIMEMLGKSALDPAEERKWIVDLNEAKTGRYDETAESLAAELMDSPRVPTSVETAGMALRAGQLVNDFNTAIAEEAELIKNGREIHAGPVRARRKMIVDKLVGLMQGARKGGTEKGRTLAIQKMLLDLNSYEIANVLVEATTQKGSQLTADETAKYEQLAKDYKDLKEKFEQQTKDYEAELAEAEKRAAEKVADQEIAAEKKRPTNTARIAKVRDKRADLYRKLEQLGYTVLSANNPEGLWILGQIAKTHFEEGALSLDEIVQQMTAKLPDISARDVWQALIAQDPENKKKAAKETNKTLKAIEREAKLLVSVGDALNGIFAKGRTAPEMLADIKALRKLLSKLRNEVYKSGRQQKALEAALARIAKLQDQLAKGETAVKEKKIKGEVPEDLVNARAKIKELETEMRLTDQKKDLLEQLSDPTKLRPKVKKPVKRYPAHLERLQVEVNEARKKIDRAIEDAKPKGRLGLLKESTDLLRQIKATADMSYTLRQLMFFSVVHPKMATDSLVAGVKAFFSQHEANAIDAAMRAHPMHYLRVGRMGIHFSELDDPRGRGEEYYHSRVINAFERKYPRLGQVFRSSSRHATVASNMFRAALADDFMAKYPNATDEELKAYGDVINKGTGIGNIGHGTLSNILPYMFFAPKFTASRFQAPWTAIDYWHLPRVRKEILKNIVADVGTGLTVLALAAMAGAKVGLNPDDPDFGKIVIGNMHIDIWAGFQQPARMITRLLASITPGVELPKGGRPADWPEIVGRFFGYKSSPALSLVHDLGTGKTLVGEEQTAPETLIRAIAPLIVEELIDAISIEGIGGAAVSAPLNFFGVGVNTYVKDAENRRPTRPQRPRRPSRP